MSNQDERIPYNRVQENKADTGRVIDSHQIENTHKEKFYGRDEEFYARLTCALEELNSSPERTPIYDKLVMSSGHDPLAE